MKHVFSFFAVLWLLSGARAELPPSAYEAMQREAPEFFSIEVLDVQFHPVSRGDSQDIEIVAHILDVKRSGSGTTAGSLIHILFSLPQRPPGFVGPAPVTVPSRGDRSPAFLRSLEKPGDFAPAAGAMSFREF